MADRVGELYFPRNAGELRDQLLRDLRLAAIDTGVAEPPTQPGTDWYLLSTAVANLALVGLANVAIADSDSSVLTATGSALERLRVAYGLPEVAAQGSSGKVRIGVSGAVTVPDGLQIQLPNGLRARVVGTFINPGDGDLVDVAAIDTGEATNFPAGIEVTFISPPPNLLETATVSEAEPLSGGTDAESAERKRKRILNALQNRPAGGNWSHLREMALNASGVVQDCFVYPALGGPGSAKLVPVRKFDRVNRSFTRALTVAQIAPVRAAIQAQMPSPAEVVVQAVADQLVDVALNVKLPDSTLSGGTGQGWLDAVPWPPLVGGDSGRAIVTSSAGANVTINAQTSTAPIANQTHIAWWSAIDRRFYVALVVIVAGSAGAWVLTTVVPLVDSSGAGPQAGDFICPAARNMQAYGDAWLDLLEELGPGENTSDVNRLPRAKRRPLVGDGALSSLGAAVYSQFMRRFDEITDISQSHASATVPTVPGSVATAPNVLVPRHFAIYVL
jgi:uncharacterized phage protein gp47/JayE